MAPASPASGPTPAAHSAESTSSGETGIVEHEIARPRDDRWEPAGPLAQCQVRDSGSPRKMTNAPIDKPRTSQRLTTESSIPTKHHIFLLKNRHRSWIVFQNWLALCTFFLKPTPSTRFMFCKLPKWMSGRDPARDHLAETTMVEAVAWSVKHSKSQSCCSDLLLVRRKASTRVIPTAQFVKLR